LVHEVTTFRDFIIQRPSKCLNAAAPFHQPILFVLSATNSKMETEFTLIHAPVKRGAYGCLSSYQAISVKPPKR